MDARRNPALSNLRWMPVFAWFWLSACQASASVPSAAESAAPPASVAGDLIVKFSDGSTAGKEVASILAGQKTVDDSRTTVDRLAGQLQVPLVPVRVTSGRELLLAVDRGEITRRLERSAASRKDVERVIPLDAEQKVLPADQLTYEVRPGAGSDLQRQLARDAAARVPSVRAQQLAAEIAGDFAAHSRASFDEHDRLLLTLDVTALTRSAVERLQKLPEVEYAQANQILKHGPVRP